MKHSNISIFIPHLGCPFNCIFCDQFKITGSDSAVTPSDVYNTLSNALKSDTINKGNTQIAFFGGSFTAIPKSLMIEYLEVANKFIGLGKFESIRISTRPDCIDKETLEILKKYNVKTIELGIQSLDEDVLIASKRGHSVKTALESCRLIIDGGFELGMQMMCGLPEDNYDKDIKTAKKIIELGCKQVRIYPVVVIEGTYLAKMYKESRYTPLNVEEAIEICSDLYKLFTDNDVTVLKVGLHSDSDSIAGPFHPAFGELVRSEVFYKTLTNQINIKNAYTVYVSNSFISIAKGNCKRNELKLMNNNYNVTFKVDPKLQKDSYKIIKVSQ